MPNNNTKYRYIGSSTRKEDQVYNSDYFDKLRNNRQYEDAYDYAMQFALNNPNDEAERRHYLKAMRREGRKVNAVYENSDEALWPIIDFRNAVETPGGLETLSENNKYGNEFKQYKANLGSGMNKIAVEFQPRVQKGIFGLDSMATDNTDNDIEAFYNRTGFNKEYLQSNNVNVRLVNGKTYLEFDKSNDLANTILMNIHDENPIIHANNLPFRGNKIYGIKEDGSYTEADNRSHVNIVPPAPPFNEVSSQRYLIQSDLSKMQSLYKDASRIEDKAYFEGTAKIKQHSSQVFPLIHEAKEELREQRDSGLLKDASYNSRVKEVNDELIAGLALAGFENYDILTYYDTETNTNNPDHVNRPLQNSVEKNKISDRYRGVKNKDDIEYGVVITDGRVGLIVQLPAVTTIKGNEEVVIKEPCTFSMFGDDIEQTLQYQINSDPKMQAYQEINDMQDLGYTYKDNNGESYTYDGNGGWIVNGTDRTKTEDYVLTQIYKDKASDDLGTAITLNNVSVNGVLTNPNRYDLQLKTTAFVTANDFDNNTDILEELKAIYGDDYDDSSVISITDMIFGLKGIGNVVADEYVDRINGKPLRKLNDIYELYDSMKNIGKRYIKK